MSADTSHACRKPLDIKVGGWDVPPFDVKGKTTKAKVSAAGNVYAGEFVQRVHELEQVEELRFALDGVKILAAAPIGDKRVGVVFTRDGSTWFKVLKYDGGLLLGNTCAVVEGVLEAAVVVGMSDTTAAVLYNADAAGQIAVLKLTDRLAELVYTDLWDVCDPTNITASALDGTHLLAGGVRQEREHAGQATYTSVAIGESKVTLGGEVQLAAQYDEDEYAGAWALAALTPTVAVASYFDSHAAPIGLAVLDVEAGKPTIRWTGKCVYLGSLPCTSLTNLGGGWFAAVNGLARVDATGKVVKTALSCELWQVTEFGARPCWYATEGTDYSVNVGLASVLPARDGLVLSYSAEGVAKSMLVDVTERGPDGGPAVGHGGFEEFCRVVPVGNTFSLLVTQREGSGYVTALRRVETVVSAEGTAEGVAKTGGGPGATISVIMDTK